MEIGNAFDWLASRGHDCRARHLYSLNDRPHVAHVEFQRRHAREYVHAVSKRLSRTDVLPLDSLELEELNDQRVARDVEQGPAELNSPTESHQPIVRGKRRDTSDESEHVSEKAGHFLCIADSEAHARADHMPPRLFVRRRGGF